MARGQKDVEVLVTNNSKAKRILGWKPMGTFERGICKTIKWYQDDRQTWLMRNTRGNGTARLQFTPETTRVWSCWSIQTEM